jgi:hypothetical protein
MQPNEAVSSNDRVVYEVTRNQLEHFTGNDPRCRGLQLPEGLMLRYTLSKALYFYLRSGVREGKISTHVFASDTPYDRQKTPIGEVLTPMFDAQADRTHLKKVEALLFAWVDFVKEGADDELGFKSFTMGEKGAE